MGSTRLPGKVLLTVAGRPMLAWQLDRLRSTSPDLRVAVATSQREADDPIAALCTELGVPVVRGSELDVLDRYHLAAEQLHANPVIRVTADCPLIDPLIVVKVLDLWSASGADYASNTLERTFPRGLDTEVMSFGALETAWHEARAAHEREHVTPFIYRRPERFTLANLRNSLDEGARRWTVDTADDLAFTRTIFEELAPRGHAFTTDDVRELLAAQPWIELLNRDVPQKTLPA